MSDKQAELGVLTLQRIVDWLRLPPRMELMKDGLDTTAELYGQVATRVASAHLGAVGLMLVRQGPDRYEVDLRPGADWRDVAYYLGHAANLRAGRLLVNHPDELLTRDLYSGQPTRFEDHRQAVLSQLGVLGAEPGQEQGPARVFRAALEAAQEAAKMRSAA